MSLLSTTATAANTVLLRLSVPSILPLHRQRENLLASICPFYLICHSPIPLDNRHPRMLLFAEEAARFDAKMVARLWRMVRGGSGKDSDAR